MLKGFGKDFAGTQTAETFAIAMAARVEVLKSMDIAPAAHVSRKKTASFAASA